MHALPYWRLSGYYFFYFAFVGAFSPYFGLYLQSLSFSAWDIGLLMSQMQLMRLCAPFLWGALADHLAQRMAVVRLAALLSLIGFAGFFAVQGFVPVLLAMALLAFFWSAALPLVETVTFDHLRDQSGRYSRIRLWGSIGFILAVMATGALLDELPLPSLLWVIVGTLAGILIYALAIPEAPMHGYAAVSYTHLDVYKRQVYGRLDAEIAYAMMGINAVKGVEIGAGFASIAQKGSEHGDEMTPQGFLSNHAGGVLGGISSGQDLRVNLAIKPTSSIRLPRRSVDLSGQAMRVETHGRHDPCVGIRATPIAEAMLALVLIDQALRHRAQCGDVVCATPRIAGRAVG